MGCDNMMHVYIFEIFLVGQLSVSWTLTGLFSAYPFQSYSSPPHIIAPLPVLVFFKPVGQVCRPGGEVYNSLNGPTD